jgi:hypothetical protein
MFCLINTDFFTLALLSSQHSKALLAFGRYKSTFAANTAVSPSDHNRETAGAGRPIPNPTEGTPAAAWHTGQVSALTTQPSLLPFVSTTIPTPPPAPPRRIEVISLLHCLTSYFFH